MNEFRSFSKKIVVIGGGFGGMAAIHALNGVDASITLIDRTNHFLFQPLLYQVATAALSPADIAEASRAMVRRNRSITVLMAEVTSIDPHRKTLVCGIGPEIDYDYLIIATGVKYSFFGHDEWAKYVYVLKNLKDALLIRERVLGAFEQAEECGDPELIRRLLTFIVVGAGPTGVELAGTIAELARSTLAKDFKNIAPQSARIILCEAGNRALAAFPERLSNYAKKTLESLGVELLFGKAVTNIDQNGLSIDDTYIESDCVLWCAGTKAEPAAVWLDVPSAKNGSIIVEADCSVPGHPEIFAIGDVSSLKDAASGKPLPGLAPVAKQQGAYVGKRIKLLLSGHNEMPPFKYKNYGTMAVIGRSRAVAQFGKLNLTGFLAWLSWSLVHLMLLTDFRSRTNVFLNWAWAWFTYGRGARLLIGNTPASSFDELPKSTAGVDGEVEPLAISFSDE